MLTLSFYCKNIQNWSNKSYIGKQIPINLSVNSLSSIFKNNYFIEHCFEILLQKLFKSFHLSKYFPLPIFSLQSLNPYLLFKLKKGET